MNRRELLISAAAGGVLARALRAAIPERPNIIFILADDLGYGDLSCYGRPDYKTPALDQMAREGVKFTDSYASAPMCTPTRVASISGRYPHRLAIGLQEPLPDANLQVGLPPEHPTIASLLKRADYETALIGKWHLGNTPEFGPNRHGFDEFYGLNGSSADYFTHVNLAGRYDLYENLQPSKDPGYLTELFTKRAVQFLSRKHQRPFFLSLHYNAPHWPWEGPGDKDISHDHRLNGQGLPVAGGSPAIYTAMMRSLDAGVGQVLKAVRSSRLDRNTLVIFTSDNGGERYSFNWPFSFGKFNLWEGGIRVPAIVRWPGVVPAGRTTSQVAATFDWTATILAAGGGKADPNYPLDGENLLEVCTGRRAPFDRTLFWRTATQDAARMGEWKYLREGGNEHLFDLSTDPGEKAEMRFQQAGVFEKIRGLYQKWNGEMLPRAKTVER